MVAESRARQSQCARGAYSASHVENDVVIDTTDTGIDPNHTALGGRTHGQQEEDMRALSKQIWYLRAVR
jgi:hypothetical protein